MRTQQLCVCFVLTVCVTIFLLIGTAQSMEMEAAPGARIKKLWFEMSSSPVEVREVLAEVLEEESQPVNASATPVYSFGDTWTARDERKRDHMIWLLGLLIGGACVWLTLLRALVRIRDSIPGSALRDCCVTLCCCCCSVCQLARHEGLVQGQYGICSPTGQKKVVVHAEVMGV